MTHDDRLDYALRARTRCAMRAADFACDLIAIKVALLIFMALVYIGLSWLRALGWWQEIGCSAWSLPALYAESLGVGWDTDLFKLCVATTPVLAIASMTGGVRA